ncbi:MAG: hypothetical protein IT162_02680 [Bryobacterales bacterium]|nr:hypothetical protein [Bryobacterales bacterium]
MTVRQSFVRFARAASSLLLALVLLLANGGLAAALTLSAGTGGKSMRCCRTKRACCCRKQAAGNQQTKQTTVSARTCPDTCSLPASASPGGWVGLAAQPTLGLGLAASPAPRALLFSAALSVWHSFALRQRPPPPAVSSTLS